MPADSTDSAGRVDPLERMAGLKSRGKAPSSASTLDRWVSQAQAAAGLEAQRLRRRAGARTR